jgi:hypothetical protein
MGWRFIYALMGTVHHIRQSAGNRS